VVTSGIAYFDANVAILALILSSSICNFCLRNVAILSWLFREECARTIDTSFAAAFRYYMTVTTLLCITVANFSSSIKSSNRLNEEAVLTD